MKSFCNNIKYDLADEKELHKKVISLREQKKSFKEISDATGIPIVRLGYFISTDINKIWTLDDWIKDYYPKDSSIYPKVDFLIDNDKKFLLKFSNKGIKGTFIEKL